MTDESIESYIERTKKETADMSRFDSIELQAVVYMLVWTISNFLSESYPDDHESIFEKRCNDLMKLFLLDQSKNLAENEASLLNRKAVLSLSKFHFERVLLLAQAMRRRQKHGL